MLDGSADGTLFVTGFEEFQLCSKVCFKDYIELCDNVKHGNPDFF
jgi:hypothetical protein